MLKLKTTINPQQNMRRHMPHPRQSERTGGNNKKGIMDITYISLSKVSTKNT